MLLAPSHFYLVYNTGNTLMRWAPASELRARTLLTEYIGRRIGHPAYAGQNAEALLLCEDLSLAPTLFRSRGGGKRQLFFLDGTFDHMYLLSNNAQGDVLFQILRKPGVSSAFNTALAGTLYPNDKSGIFPLMHWMRPGAPFCLHGILILFAFRVSIPVSAAAN